MSRSPARVAAALRDARRQMDSVFFEKIVVADLATSVGLSTYGFIRSFSAAFGETPGQYLTRLKMERAKILLVSSGLPIREVGRLVGYRSHGSFSNRFRKFVGMSPTEYRKQHHRGSAGQPAP